jgi:hypothetical protein
MKRALLVFSCLLLLTLAVVGWNELHCPRPVALTPTLTGQTEYCLTCHADLAQISDSHPVGKYGCVICHGGERLALEAGLAHSTLRGGKNPADLSVVEASCGGPECHSGSAETGRDQIQRVANSLRVTYAGAIAAIRYEAGLQPDLAAREGLVTAREATGTNPSSLQALALFDPSTETSPKVQAFAQNCLNCHLSAQPLPGQADVRMTGCAACHITTVNLDPSQPIHRFNTAVAYSQCNTCHNRGAYNLADIQFSLRTDQPADRQQAYYLPNAKYTKCEIRLDCIDCHTGREIMGDGHLYGNMAEAGYIQCRTCHGTIKELPLTYTISRPDDPTLRLASLNPAIRLRTGDTVIITEKGEPLWNTRQRADGSFELVGKATGQHFIFRPVKGSACQQNPDQQDPSYCHACHSVQS